MEVEELKSQYTLVSSACQVYCILMWHWGRLWGRSGREGMTSVFNLLTLKYVIYVVVLKIH